jgi:hypothetical protein
LEKLCGLVAGRRLSCPDGVEREFGNSLRAAGLKSTLLALGELHKLINRKEPLCEHEIAGFPRLVERYMVGFAIYYPTITPTPKMHVLGYHLHDLLVRHGSIGMDSEQGVESYHPEMTTIQNNYRHLERRPEAQLAAMADAAWARGGGSRVKAAPGLMDARRESAECVREGHKESASKCARLK